jgi:hypothetical protein
MSNILRFDSDDAVTEDKINFKNLVKISKWRIDLLNDLKKRNLKEFSNIDKISVPYENDVYSFIHKLNIFRINNLFFI